MSATKQERMIAYVDGFNLYSGLKESRFDRYFWLNIEALVESLLKPNQNLVSVKYFTSLITNNSDKRLRQREYLKALSTASKIRIIYGAFQQESLHCNVCGNDSTRSCEKMTDVNIATHLLDDFFNDRFDWAILISGDSDLIPPMHLINESDTNKKVLVAFPPNRANNHVRKHAAGDFVIGRKKLADSQFLDEIIINETEKIIKPITWV